MHNECMGLYGNLAQNSGKMAKIDTQFMTKRAENHTLWGRTYLYGPYRDVDRVSIEGRPRCRSSVDRGSIKVSIASIDRHSIAGVNSTHDPYILLCLMPDNFTCQRETPQELQGQIIQGERLSQLIAGIYFHTHT